MLVRAKGGLGRRSRCRNGSRFATHVESSEGDVVVVSVLGGMGSSFLLLATNNVNSRPSGVVPCSLVNCCLRPSRVEREISARLRVLLRFGLQSIER